MFNPQWLKSFSVVAELGSFTQTAEQLSITQAAVSQHVRHLEDRLGPLLIRKSRQIDLTPSGRILLEYCRDLERASNKLHLCLSGADAVSGDIKVISPGSIGLLINPILLDLQQENPGLVIRHRFAPDREILEAILQNQYELGLLTYKPDDPRIVAERFVEEPLELVIPAGQNACSWEDLMQLGFIDHPDGQAMATRFLSRRFPGNPGIRHIPCHGYINQIGLILEPVARGLGFTILPHGARQSFRLQDAIQVVECGISIVDTLWLIHRAEWPLSARASNAVRYLRQHLPACI